MSLEFEPIELIYFVLVIVALGFALFFLIVSFAICCSYVKSGFGVTTEDTLASNETSHGPQILSVVSMDPSYFDRDGMGGSREYKTYLSSPNYNRFATVDEPPPKYDQIFSSKLNTFY